MKNLKKTAVILAGILLLVSLCACASQPNSQAAAEWTVEVEGASKAEFTSLDYAKLTTVKIDTVSKKKDGTEVNETWEGVLLKDVLAALGVKEYESVTMTASDDYSKDYTPDIVNDEKTILGTSVNGEKLTAEDGFVQAVAGNQGSNMKIKNLKKIKVNK